MSFYIESKGLGVRGHIPNKNGWDKVITDDKVKKILKAVEASKDENPQFWWRDYGLIYMAYFLGMRIGEACIFEKRHCVNLEDHEQILVPTLKKSVRVSFKCRYCKRFVRLATFRIGRLFECKCGKTSLVKADLKDEKGTPEYPSPFVEPQVKDFVLRYISHMRPDQDFFFESKRGRHISKGYASRIFSTYAQRAKLSPKLSFHCLRHGRGQKLYSIFKDLKTVMDGLRHSSIKSAQVYASFDEERKSEIRRKLGSEAFTGADLGAHP